MHKEAIRGWIRYRLFWKSSHESPDSIRSGGRRRAKMNGEALEVTHFLKDGFACLGICVFVDPLNHSFPSHHSVVSRQLWRVSSSKMRLPV